MNCDRGTTLAGDVDYGGGYGYLGKGSRGNLCTSAQFFCQPITALKNEVNLKNSERCG